MVGLTLTHLSSKKITTNRKIKCGYYQSNYTHQPLFRIRRHWAWTPKSSPEPARNRLRGEGRQRTGQSRPVTTSSLLSRWPSRPGEPQYEWEEPRVVVNTASKGLEGGRGSSLQGTDEGLTSADRVTGQAESKLGRTSNGSTCGVDATANRVDRLRLLGNGVVNQTAAKAFVTLIQRVTNK